MLACNVFVKHIGTVSFGAKKKERAQDAYETTLRRNPLYADAIDQHIASRPVTEAFRRIDLARMRRT